MGIVGREPEARPAGMTLEGRYRDVVRRVGGRARLVAVSKSASLDDVRALHALGQRDFGENRADALTERARTLPADARWHFIGHLQSNKLKLLAELKPLVHSFDRADLAQRWIGAPILVQVDFSGAPQRSGVPPSQLADVLAALRRADVDVRGLSTLPPREGDPRAWFRALRALRDLHGLKELSMGMSEDFEVAIDEGATIVRVGRAIFG